MVNILLTNRCNRSCPYCFARREMAEAPGERLSFENLVYLADLLQRSGERKVSLLGGEPTIHPAFVDYVLYLLARGFDVTVFTNGMLSEERLAEFREHLTAVSPRRLSFVCNLNDPAQTPASESETRRVEAFLSAAGPWTQPGFNIYRLDFSLDFLFDLVLRHGMKRTIRLGLTHPVPGADSGFIAPEDIGKVIERLYSLKPVMDRLRMKPGLDCGFPLCRFTDLELGWLQRLSGHSKFSCGPAIDIGPDMSVYSCFPLSSFHRKSIFEFDHLRQVDDYFKRIHDLLRIELPGIYDDCDGCVHRAEGLCSGGGVCHLLHRLQGEPPVRLPEIQDGTSGVPVAPRAASRSRSGDLQVRGGGGRPARAEPPIPITSSRTILAPPDRELLRRLGGREVGLRIDDPSAVAAARESARAAGADLVLVLVESTRPLDEIEVREDWKVIPIALVVPSAGRFRGLFRRVPALRALDLEVYLPASRENLTAARVLSSVGIRSGLLLGEGTIDWEALADLMTYALLEPAPHAEIEPFATIAARYRPAAYTQWGGACFDDPSEYLHLDAEGRVALSRGDLRDGNFLGPLQEVERPEGPAAFEARRLTSKQVFLENELCGKCPGFRVCLARFAREHAGAGGCSRFFAELMDVVEQRLGRNSGEPEVAAWRP